MEKGNFHKSIEHNGQLITISLGNTTQIFSIIIIHITFNDSMMASMFISLTLLATEFYKLENKIIFV